MSNPPYSSNGIRVATLFALLVAGFVGAGLGAWQWVLPSGVVVGLVGVKLFGAKAIPWVQIVVASVVIVAVNLVIEYLAVRTGLPPIIKLGELLVPLICVLGFGRHWVKNGYIPAAANRW